MNGEDWTDYVFQSAPRTLLCQFRRKEWSKVHVGYAKDFPPESNIAGLEWKLTGIAREQLDHMPPEVKRQMMPEYSTWTLLGRLMASPYLRQRNEYGICLTIFGDSWVGVFGSSCN
jgi:hypothetical protein